MKAGRQYDRYNLTHLSLGERTIPAFDDYQPEPPLDIDPRPIDGDALRAWRESTKRAHKEKGAAQRHLCQGECAEVFGVACSTWHRWEVEDLTAGGYAALVRAFAAGEVDASDIAHRPGTPGEVKALAQLVGYDGLADVTGLAVSTLHTYGSRGAPVQTGWGPAFAWLVADMGLEEVDAVCKSSIQSALHRSQVARLRHDYRDGASPTALARREGVPLKTALSAILGESWASMADPPPCEPQQERHAMTRQQVAKIRRRVRDGESIHAVAQEHPQSYSGIHRAVRGETWAHLDDPAPVPAEGGQR